MFDTIRGYELLANAARLAPCDLEAAEEISVRQGRKTESIHLNLDGSSRIPQANVASTGCHPDATSTLPTVLEIEQYS